MIAGRLGVRAPAEVLLAPEDGATRAWLYRVGAVIEEKLSEDGRVALTVRADPALMERLGSLPTVLLQGEGTVHKLSTLAN